VARGDIDTGFIERELPALTGSRPITAADMGAACAAALARERAGQPASANGIVSPWERTDGWMLAGRRSRRLSFARGTERRDAVLCYERDGMTMQLAGSRSAFAFVKRKDARLDVSLDHAMEQVSARWDGRDLDLMTPRGPLRLHWIDPFAGDLGETADAGHIVAPMPGTVTRILAQEGADLPRGAPLLVLEAMKMEHTLRAPAEGRLKALKCAVGDFVQEGTELADFEPAAG
jgi:3-methylcrotonyl-CoA carboxylase alpha subunit